MSKDDARQPVRKGSLLDKLRSIGGLFADKSGKRKLMLILGAVGLLLILLPMGNFAGGAASEKQRAAQSEQPDETEKRLEQILSNSKGVGRVEVMLTTERSEYAVYADDERSSEDSEEKKLVSLPDGNGGQAPVLIAVQGSRYRGAIIACDGAADPVTCLQITRAVCAVTGLGSDKVEIIGMAK